MRLTWVDLLTFGSLRDAKVIAGANGVRRQIKAISVYDVLPADDFYPDEDGMLYITTFSQFEGKEELMKQWIVQLNQNHSAGICTQERVGERLSKEIILLCNNLSFPIISVYDDFTYAEMIESVSTLLYFNKRNVLQEEKLGSLMRERLTREEKIRAIEYINSNFERLVKVIAVEGEFESELSYRRINTIFSGKKEDTYLTYEDGSLIILSESDEIKLARKENSIQNLIRPLFKDARIGIGKSCPVLELAWAVESAQTALKVAKLKNTCREVYDEFSDLVLFYPLVHTEAADRFYHHFIDLIEAQDPMGKMEYIRCVKEFVDAKGDYHTVAQNMHQHENTIRYRINRVKSILGFENNTVKFYEMISVFTALDRIMHGSRFESQ